MRLIRFLWSFPYIISEFYQERHPADRHKSVYASCKFSTSETYHVESASTCPNVHLLSPLLSPARDRMSRVSFTNQPMRNHIMHKPATMTAHRIMLESRSNSPGRRQTVETRKSTRYAVTLRHKNPATVQNKIAILLNDLTFKQGLSSYDGSTSFTPHPDPPSL